MTRVVCLLYAWVVTIAALIGAFLAARNIYFLYSLSRPEMVDPTIRQLLPYIAAVVVFLVGLLPAVWFFVQARMIELLGEIRDELRSGTGYRMIATQSPPQQTQPHF